MASIFSAILRGEFRADSCARVLAIATLLGAGSMASAQSFVQLPNSGNTSVLNGTLLSTTVTISGATSNLQVAPSINPPYNAYDIWDNAPTPNTTGLTPAAIYPATARGNPQIVITSPGASTAASPYRVTVHFGKAVQDRLQHAGRQVERPELHLVEHVQLLTQRVLQDPGQGDHTLFGYFHRTIVAVHSLKARAAASIPWMYNNLWPCSEA